MRLKHGRFGGKRPFYLTARVVDVYSRVVFDGIKPPSAPQPRPSSLVLAKPSVVAEHLSPHAPHGTGKGAIDDKKVRGHVQFLARGDSPEPDMLPIRGLVEGLLFGNLISCVDESHGEKSVGGTG